MAYVHIEDFKLGLDRRKSRINGTPGSLWTLKNAHLTRGGEIERSKAFVPEYTLPANTFGLEALLDDVYVFGSIADPGMPAGITYMRLQHPDGSTAMAELLDTEANKGKIYAIARFADGLVVHFYDGEIVTDWLAGTVRYDFTNNAGTADHLGDLIDAHEDYSTTVTSNTITVTGAVNIAFPVTVEATNGGAVNDQTITYSTTQDAIVDVAEELATASFRILGGSSGAGNEVASVKINGVEVMNVAQAWTTSNANTAALVAAQINTYTSSPQYTATSDGDTVTISAVAGSGATPNDFVLAVEIGGDVRVCNGSFEIVAGTGSDTFTSVKVNGAEILGSNVTWATSNTATAADIASTINAYASDPKYRASVQNAKIYVFPVLAANELPVGHILAVQVTGPLDAATINATAVSVNTTCTPMSGGVTQVVGQPQITNVVIGGTFDPGDEFSIILGEGEAERHFGASGNPRPIAEKVLTHDEKMYALSDSLVNFSGIGDASFWNRDNPEVPGAGFINVSAQDAGAQKVRALSSYQEESMAFFTEETIQIWQVDPDPAQNRRKQTLRNIGTRAPGSVLPFGNSDVFFLADSGVRSLRVRDLTNAAFASDIGVPIDQFIIDYMATLTEQQISDAVAVLEPRSDRYWLKLADRIFVFSYFTGSKISGWSYYEPGIDIEYMVRGQGHIYVRSGNTIYVYGGLNGSTYPAENETPVSVELPYVSARSPATMKNVTGIDLALSNTWEVEILVSPADPLQIQHVGSFGKTTFGAHQTGITGETSHIAMNLTCSAAGYALLSSVTVHYDPTDAE